MQALLGFEISFWDYVTFAALFVILLAGGALAVFILGLPGRIAIARHHPEAEAVNMMGWVGFLAVVPWMRAMIWAFKPTDVIDLRYLPKDVHRETEAMLARLTGKTAEQQPPPEQAPSTGTPSCS